MTTEENLKEVRTLVNQLDGIAQLILDHLDEVEDCLDSADLELHEKMGEIQDNVTEYQESKGYI
jgi:uncharacterized coiled-coil DUF342 family protein